MMELYEKLGLFYLGQEGDEKALTLYKSKYLTTHAAIIGMTGSGKTGLGIGLIEEAAIDNIPAILIDPKGDMGNLCLTFPDLAPEDFEPWIDETDAAAKGLSVHEAAGQTAKMWSEGIASHHQDKARIKRLKAVDVTIYTPGSSAGVGINILGSFDAPSAEVLDDPDTFSALISATVSSLLSLVSVKADALTSKEFILLSNIFKHFWFKGQSLSLEALIGQIANPPFSKIGVLNLNDFYPQRERLDLAMLFNNVLSSVSFETWTSGEALDIQNLLYDENGKAKISIFSIAHLNDAQRMFFVTLLLNRFIDWMRSQRGASTLKALLYMDEIFGFFPPTKNPPSKEPMLLLLKQARAFGVGVILSTQNPVDIDYKGLSNIGTWFIGKLQSRQDIDKVIDALAGKSRDLDKSELRQMISTLKGRTFFLKSTHEDKIRLFGTRWVLSYLKGPMSKKDIATLMKPKKMPSPVLQEVGVPKPANVTAVRAVLSDGIVQYFNDTSMQTGEGFYPYLAASAAVRYYNRARVIDEREKVILKYALDAGEERVRWEEAVPMPEVFERLPRKCGSGASFAPLPRMVSDEKSLKIFERALKEYLYANRKIELFRCKQLKIESKPHESLRDFKVHVNDLLSEKKEEAVETLKERYGAKEQRLQQRYQRAMEKLSKEENDVASKTTDTAISFGLTILGALFGKGGSTLSKGARTMRGGKNVLKERHDVKRARSSIADIEEEMEALEIELEGKIDRLDEEFGIDNYTIESFYITPRKTDVTIERVALLWER